MCAKPKPYSRHPQGILPTDSQPCRLPPMRYLSSISLALIVLITLACTAAPPPTPTAAVNICDSLYERLAAAQTDLAARVLYDAWIGHGCKDDMGIGTRGSVKRTPAKIPTATPDIWVNARLKGRWRDILASYANTSEGNQQRGCLLYATRNYSGANETETLYHHGGIVGLLR